MWGVDEVCGSVEHGHVVTVVEPLAQANLALDHAGRGAQHLRVAGDPLNRGGLHGVLALLSEHLDRLPDGLGRNRAGVGAPAPDLAMALHQGHTFFPPSRRAWRRPHRPGPLPITTIVKCLALHHILSVPAVYHAKPGSGSCERDSRVP